MTNNIESSTGGFEESHTSATDRLFFGGLAIFGAGITLVFGDAIASHFVHLPNLAETALHVTEVAAVWGGAASMAAGALGDE